MTIFDPDPGVVVERLKPVMNNLSLAADSLGHITCKKIVDTYAAAALKFRKKAVARQAKRDLLNLFKKRGVMDGVLSEINESLKAMK